MKKNSVKNRRINDEVQRALAAIVREVKDPRISPLTSITGTEVAPDLKTCKVFVSVYGNEEAGAKTMEGLKSASRFIRGELARKVNLRHTPELTFVLDDSIAYGVAMSHRIDEVTAADRNGELARGQETDESIQDE